MRQRLSVAPEAKKSKSSVHDREDYFAHLPVNVSSESFDLHDGLAGYFEDDVDFEGSKAKMHVSLVELPPILQIQLQVRRPCFSFGLHCTDLVCRELSSIERPCNLTNRMHTSSLAKPYVWIASLMMHLKKRRQGQRRFRPSSTNVVTEYNN